MSEAEFITFVKNQLRGASWKWHPLTDVYKKARVGHGLYQCAKCQQVVPATTIVNKKRVKNVLVDHIIPIVDPYVGWTNFDDFINRLFCEVDNLQVLCRECHLIKTKEETLISKERRNNKIE